MPRFALGSVRARRAAGDSTMGLPGALNDAFKRIGASVRRLEYDIGARR
jgi:hypothetical protein